MEMISLSNETCRGGSGEVERLVMCCDVLFSLPGFTILCKKFAIKQLMSDTNTNNC